jgi:putative salt-induced outer membrane protein YdiY
MIFALLSILVAAPAPDTTKHVFFTGDLGLVNASGNTELTTFSGANKFVLIGGAWKFTETFGVTYAKAHDSVTTELWQGNLRGDRDLTPRVSLFIFADFQRNTFAGLKSRYAPSFGISAVAIGTKRDTLRIEGGGGYTSQNAVAPDTNRHYPSGRFAAVYHHQLSTKAAFDETFEYLPNFQSGSDYRINSETALTAPITTGIAMKASYVIHYEGVPEPGFKTTDRILTTGIQVTF